LGVFNALDLYPGDTILALDSVDFNASGVNGRIVSGVTIDGGQHGAFMFGGAAAGLGAFGFTGTGSGTYVLRNVTIIGSNGYPAIYLNLSGGTVILDNVTVITPGVNQGAFTAAIIGTIGGGVTIHMKNVTIVGAGNGIALANSSGAPFSFAAENLSVDVTGAGVELTDGYGVIRNSRFRGSSSSTGLALLSSSSTPVWLLDTCSFQNLAYGLVAGSPGTVRISNSEFTGNTFGIFGGGTTISFRNNVFAGNGADGSPVMSTSLK
jgi:hypothetical protein